MITTILSLLAALAVFIVLMLSHELGHFLTAKAFRVKVEEFGLFFPPRIFGIKRGETIYSINALPFGAFVKLAGEDDPEVPDGLASKGAGPRILVLSAGALMNALLPLILLSAAFIIPHNQVVGEVVVGLVQPNSPAEVAGIKEGDIILAVNGKTIDNSNDVARAIQLNLSRQMTLTVKHADGTTSEAEVAPRWQPPQGQGAVGFQLGMSGTKVTRVSLPVWQAVPAGLSDYRDVFILYKNAIISTIIGATPVQFTGPVGIVQVTAEVARSGISALLEFTSFISMQLAIFNIFPLPALDGGRNAFVFLEWIRRGKRVSPKVQTVVHFIGLMMLMGFAMVVTYFDIVRIISGESLIP